MSMFTSRNNLELNTSMEATSPSPSSWEVLQTPDRGGWSRNVPTKLKPNFAAAVSPRQVGHARPRTPRSGAVSSSKKRLKLVGDVETSLHRSSVTSSSKSSRTLLKGGAGGAGGDGRFNAPSTPTRRAYARPANSPLTPSRRRLSLNSPKSDHRKKSSSSSGEFLSPRSLMMEGDYNDDGDCRYIPKRENVNMDVVRHVIVNTSQANEGGTTGKENPSVKNEPLPSPTVGVVDEFRRRMRGALLSIDTDIMPATPTRAARGSSGNEAANCECNDFENVIRRVLSAYDA